jgi:hypothetical protein
MSKFIDALVPTFGIVSVFGMPVVVVWIALYLNPVQTAISISL